MALRNSDLINEMDVKSLANMISATGLIKDKIVAPKKEVRPENTTDRDANGRREYGEGKEEQKRAMTLEELKEAVNKLKLIPGIAESQLTVRLISKNEKNFVVIEDSSGQVVRRIPEIDLWSLFTEEQATASPKGKLLNKAL